MPKAKTPAKVEQDKFAQAEKLLVSFYGPVVVDKENKKITINFDGTEAIYHFERQVLRDYSYFFYFWHLFITYLFFILMHFLSVLDQMTHLFLGS